MYYVYIIRSEKTEKMYTGSTEDLRKRISEHNVGKVTSTKTSCPWKILYYEAFVSKNDARIEELFLKTGKGRDRIKRLFKK